MKIIHGDLWQHDGAKFVTTNSYKKRDGTLVMGRGAAKQAAERLPQLPHIAGNRIEHMGAYGVLLFPDILRMGTGGVAVGIFQVKRHFRADADLDLIRQSTKQLAAIAWAWGGPICLNYPGIGFGRLSVAEVQPIISELPDNVFVFKYGD